MVKVMCAARVIHDGTVGVEVVAGRVAAGARVNELALRARQEDGERGRARFVSALAERGITPSE